jgi:hypothetical protein
MGERFDSKGMLIIPDPRRRHLEEAPKVLMITHAYCPVGHDLISVRASFNGHPGLLIRVKKGTRKGTIALSPIYGEKVRVALDIDLESGELVKLHCPFCDAALPVHSPCPSCGGEMIALFSLPEADFANCVAVCNRVDCPNASLIQGGMLVARSMTEAL